MTSLGQRRLGKVDGVSGSGEFVSLKTTPYDELIAEETWFQKPELFDGPALFCAETVTPLYRAISPTLLHNEMEVREFNHRFKDLEEPLCIFHTREDLNTADAKTSSGDRRHVWKNRLYVKVTEQAFYRFERVVLWNGTPGVIFEFNSMGMAWVRTSKKVWSKEGTWCHLGDLRRIQEPHIGGLLSLPSTVSIL